MKKVAVIMGSDSDWPVVKGACQQLETFGIPYGETQAGKSATDWLHPLNLGGVGTTGCSAANEIPASSSTSTSLSSRA